jgi:hypothetical protein
MIPSSRLHAVADINRPISTRFQFTYHPRILKSRREGEAVTLTSQYLDISEMQGTPRTSRIEDIEN